MGTLFTLRARLKSVLVDIDFVFPALALHEGSDFGGIPRIVDGNRDQFHARLLHPFRVVFGDRAQFQDARLAPSGPEADDDRLAVIGKGSRADRATFEVLDLDIGHRPGTILRPSLASNQHHEQEREEEYLFHRDEFRLSPRHAKAMPQIWRAKTIQMQNRRHYPDSIEQIAVRDVTVALPSPTCSS